MDFRNYHEPFVGSGAVFLAFRQALSADRSWRLSDANPHLICWWQAVQGSIEELLTVLDELKLRYESGDDPKGNYRLLRQEFNEHAEMDVRKAGLFMFCCRTAFNGLVRYNRKGHFNSAWGNQRGGQHKDCFIFDADHLRRLSELLQGDVKFSCGSYEIAQPGQGDFCFCDPPYVPIDHGRQIDALAYCKEGFDQKDQETFAAWCRNKKAAGVHLMVCNHDTDFIRSEFSEFSFVPYDLVKHFSGVGTARKKTTEVLICG